MRRWLAGITLMLSLCGALSAQDEREPAEQAELQRGFSSLVLGMSLEATKEALLSDGFFRYRGDPDVSFVPSTRAPIIDAEGRGFLHRGLLQFQEDQLYLVTLILNRERIDYFSVFESLRVQYGEPDSLDPVLVIWEGDDTRISLERPLTIKYTDLSLFRSIVDEGQMAESLEDISREAFLEEL